MTTCSSRLPEHHCHHEQGHLLDHKCNCGFVWAEEPYLQRRTPPVQPGIRVCREQSPEIGGVQLRCNRIKDHEMPHRGSGWQWYGPDDPVPSLGQRVIDFAETLPGYSLTEAQKRIVIKLFDNPGWTLE